MITLQESLRAVFYAPFYATMERGAFAREGVEVRFVSSPEPGRALEGLMNGSVDVGWGGPMRVNEGAATIPGADIVCFAEVVTRVGQRGADAVAVPAARHAAGGRRSLQRGADH